MTLGPRAAVAVILAACLAAVCHGRGCPRVRARRASAGRLRRTLQARVFAAGDRIELEISATGLTSERVQFKIRDGAAPLAKLF